MASHHIDLVRFLLGEIRRVFAHVQSVRSDADTATLQYELENGLSVQSFFSLRSTAEQWFEVYGLDGKFRARPYDRTDVEQTKMMQPGLMSQGIQSLLSRLGEQPLRASYRAALQHFVTCVRTKQPASPDLIDGYRSLAVIEAAEKSARTGQVESVDENALTDQA
jgi:predicted dehydrogenase